MGLQRGGSGSWVGVSTVVADSKCARQHVCARELQRQGTMQRAAVVVSSLQADHVSPMCVTYAVTWHVLTSNGLTVINLHICAG